MLLQVRPGAPFLRCGMSRAFTEVVNKLARPVARNVSTVGVPRWFFARLRRKLGASCTFVASLPVGD